MYAAMQFAQRQFFWRCCLIEIKIPKEVRDYHENIFFGLNTRQFICSVLAVGVAVGIYFALQPYVGTEEIGWMCILGAAPFAACGFFTYHGMTAEQVLWAWFKSEILCPKRLMFQVRQLLLRSHAARHPRGHETKERVAYEEKHP